MTTEVIEIKEPTRNNKDTTWPIEKKEVKTFSKRRRPKTYRGECHAEHRPTDDTRGVSMFNCDMCGLQHCP